MVKRVDKDHPALAEGANPPRWETPREICTVFGCGGPLEFKEETPAVVYHENRAEAHAHTHPDCTLQRYESRKCSRRSKIQDWAEDMLRGDYLPSYM